MATTSMKNIMLLTLPARNSHQNKHISNLTLTVAHTANAQTATNTKNIMLSTFTVRNSYQNVCISTLTLASEESPKHQQAIIKIPKN